MWFWAHEAMRPRLEAERTLEMVSALLAAGGRHLKDQEHQQYLAELRRSAGGGEMPRPAKASMDQIAAAGIGVVSEPGVHPGWDKLRQPGEEVGE